MGRKLKDFGELAPLRARLVDSARARDEAQRAAAVTALAAAREANVFRDAMRDVAPLPPLDRCTAVPPAPAPHPHQRERDDHAVLRESVSDDIDVESLLETDDSLSFRRTGVGPTS